MWKYNDLPDNGMLVHWGVKGMRWGYSYGKPNGGETAENPGAGPAGGKIEKEEEVEIKDKTVNAGYTDSLFDQKKSVYALGSNERTTYVKTGKISRATAKAKEKVNKLLNSAFGTKDKTHTITTSSGKTITRTTKGKEGSISKAINKALSKLKR